jgi:purine-binding chemotaxis protein CheW
VRHVVFWIGQERYGLPLASVREVVNPAPMSGVPRAPPAVRGIMNLRGRVITVVDLAGLLGLPPAPAPPGPPPGKVLLLDRGRRDLGLLIGEVDGVHSVEELTPAPGEALPSIRGVARSNRGAVTVLDADGLDRQITLLFRPPASLRP